MIISHVLQTPHKPLYETGLEWKIPMYLWKKIEDFPVLARRSTEHLEKLYSDPFQIASSGIVAMTRLL